MGLRQDVTGSPVVCTDRRRRRCGASSVCIEREGCETFHTPFTVDGFTPHLKKILFAHPSSTVFGPRSYITT